MPKMVLPSVKMLFHFTGITCQYRVIISTISCFLVNVAPINLCFSYKDNEDELHELVTEKAYPVSIE